MEKISFQADGLTVVGQVFLPQSAVRGGKLPALVFEGPMTGLKDQVVEVYAKKLADAGFLTLTFDHRFYGESQGEPRQFEAPGKKVEDLRDAVTYLLSRNDVDPEYIGAVGICAGGGFMAKAAALDKRIKALATVAGFYHDPNVMKAWLGEEGYRTKVELSRAAQRKYEESGVVEYIPSISEDPTETNVAMPGDEPYDYYGTARGFSPHYRNRFAVMSFEEFLNFNSIDFAGDIVAPTLVVHGTNDLYCTTNGAQNFYDHLQAEKRIHWIETTNHIDLYDQDQYVDQAVRQIEAWFHEHLQNTSRKV
ncbi:alpha/beta hydrolase [Paenibacillus andongensis]|uniref:alpha/beta hydrolase n=1 Tax=Paenibacillus andongensis TaxID=2975482 RepID=UPI0021BA875F|nr:alpha/beta hydrolase [Paenibacillus andongensis]